VAVAENVADEQFRAEIEALELVPELSFLQAIKPARVSNPDAKNNTHFRFIMVGFVKKKRLNFSMKDPALRCKSVYEV
jgi:hypothetical protein